MNIDRQNKHKKTLNHLNRIKGQITVLEKYIIEDRPCREIAQLTASITASFQSLKIRTLNAYIQHELVKKDLPEKQKTELIQILKLFRK
jgi:DNA-binding FrmR family transcriptional regulator